MVGEFRYGLGVRDTNVNIKAGNDTPIIRFAGSPVSGTIIGNAGNFPIHRDQLDHQLVYNVSTLLGSSHNLKAGTDLRFSALDDLAQNFHRGFWSFTASCGGVTYPSSWAAFWDGCVNSYQKAYGPDLPREPHQRVQLLRRRQLEGAAEPHAEPRAPLRVRRGGQRGGGPHRLPLRRRQGQRRAPRRASPGRPQWSSGFLGRLSGGPGNFSIRGGYGLYDGRIFQSVFSQPGREPPRQPAQRALPEPHHDAGRAEPVRPEPAGSCSCRARRRRATSEALPPPTWRCRSRHQWNLSLERALPWRSSLRLTYSAALGRGLLRFDAHQPAPSWGSRWWTIPTTPPRPASPTCAGCASTASPRTGAAQGRGSSPASRPTRPARMRCRSPITRSASACPASTSDVPTRASERTRSSATTRRPGTTGCRSSGRRPSAAASGSTPATPGARPSTTRRRRRSWARGTRTPSARTRRSAGGCPASTPRTASPSTARGACPSSGNARTWWAPSSAGGRSRRSSRSRTARPSRSSIRPAAISTSTASPRTVR